MRPIKVLIGIQARSTSERFARKSFAEFVDGTMTELVLRNARKACEYLLNKSRPPRPFFSVSVALLIPTGDPLKEYSNDVSVIEGDEFDVLSRYEKAFEEYSPDYLVRITGDCPLLPETLITKAIISCATPNNLDYVSNVDQRYRTFPDGYDVEVMSASAFSYLSLTARDPYDREHVTTLLRSNPPHWLKVGHIIGRNDFSDLKISVDTKDDFAVCKRMYESLRSKLIQLSKDSQVERVFRF